MHSPFKVEVYRLEEILYSIYGDELGEVNTQEATRAFMDWVDKHNAYYYITTDPDDPNVIMKAILATVMMKRPILVLARISKEGEEEG